MKRGINKDDIKLRNRGLVLKQIACKQSLSRTEITKQMGLTKMTVSNIISELIAEDFVVETTFFENHQVGRKPVLLEISPKAPQLVGMYLSRDQLQVVLCNLSCQILYKNMTALSNENSASLTEKIFSELSKAIAKASAPVLGIGVSSIGPLDSRSGMILKPTNFFHIENYPLASLLRDHFSLPVTVNNDMDAAALAEQLFGYGSTFHNFVYLGISNGIGSGIVSDGSLFQNSSGFIGEIGHMGINQTGALCACGRKGCLETYAAMPLILSRLQQAMNDPALTYADFASISLASKCDSIFLDIIDALSYALTSVVNLLDPDAIIIGHEGIFLPRSYLLLLESQINKQILSANYKSVKVLTSSFGLEAPLIGSVTFLLRELFSGRICSR